jgi:hypothetical protein
MELSKKKLLSLIKENINEMAMDFDTQDRPNSDLQNKLRQGDTPLTKVPLPKTGQEPNKNFQELLASERYKQVIENLRRYVPQFQGNLNGMDGMMQLHDLLGQAFYAVTDIERNHREELERLAVELVITEMGLGEDEIDFDVKIVGMGEIPTDDFNREQGDQPNPQEVDVDGEQPSIDPANAEEEIELFHDLENFELESAKRRLINAMTQGASKRGHYMYHLVGEKIQEITGSEQLLGLYGILMSINDVNYWQFSDQTISGAGDSVAGKVKVETPEGDNEDEEGGEDPEYAKPKVIARGINFPVLVHELVKGVIEVIGTQGQPNDRELFQQVMQQEDTLEKEMWDLRLGPAIWDRIRAQFPEETLMESGKYLQNYILMNIFKLPAKQFLVLMKEVISDSDKGKRLMINLLRGIQEMLNQQDYEYQMDRFKDELEGVSNETQDDELTSFLDNLGIKLSDDDDEDDDDIYKELGLDRPKR